MKIKCCEIEKINSDLTLTLNKKTPENIYYLVGKNTTKITLKNNKQIKTCLCLLFFDNEYKSAIKIEGELTSASNLKLCTIFISSNIKANLNITVKDKNTKIEHKSLILGHNESKQDIEIYFENTSSHTFIDQEIIAICENKATAKVNCQGKINKVGIKSTNTQTLKGINIGDSKISLIPILLIDNFDVKAAHSASVGSLNENDLFYIQSRGLNRQMAIKLLLNAYIEPIFANIKNNDIKKMIKQEVENVYENKE